VSEENRCPSCECRLPPGVPYCGPSCEADHLRKENEVLRKKYHDEIHNGRVRCEGIVELARGEAHWEGLNRAGRIAEGYAGETAVMIATAIMKERGECGCKGAGLPHWHNNESVERTK